MDVYSRQLKTGERVWYVNAHYWQDGKRKRQRRSTGVRDDGTSKSERTAEVVGRDIEQSLALGQGRVARPTTVTQAIDKLIEQMEVAGRAQPTINIVIEKSVHLFDFFGATTPIEQVTDFSKYAKAALPVRGPATVKRELRTMAQAFRALKITPPEMPEIKEPDARERFLSRQEQLLLLASTPALRKDHVLMYLHLGLSKSELFRIEQRDCNFERREVRVRGTKAEKRDRLLPMSDEVYDVLMARRKSTPMFEAWLQGNADRELRRWAERAGLGPVSFNDLRRTFATTLAAAGVPILHLMHLMGHSSTRMLEKVYARVGTGEHMHDAIKKLSPLRKRGLAKKEA